MTKLVGILNITPDSFSDGNQYGSLRDIIKKIEGMIENNVAIIDIGAESTRPNATALSHIEEWQRLEPYIIEVIRIIKSYNLDISIDTRHYQTAEKLLNLGVNIINDVSGLKSKNMCKLANKTQCKVILMHNLGIAADPNVTIDENKNAGQEIFFWAQQKIHQLNTEFNIDKSNIIFDVGIGFGKNSKQTFEILKEIDIFKKLMVPIYVGHSRKSFLKKFTTEEASLRDFETAIISSYLMLKNVDFIRIHNVEMNNKVANILKAIS